MDDNANAYYMPEYQNAISSKKKVFASFYHSARNGEMADGVGKASNSTSTGFRIVGKTSIFEHNTTNSAAD